MNIDTGELFKFNNNEEFLQVQATLKDKLLPISEAEYNQHSEVLDEKTIDDLDNPKTKVYKEPKIRCKRTHADKKKKARRKMASASKRKNR